MDAVESSPRNVSKARREQLRPLVPRCAKPTTAERACGPLGTRSRAARLHHIRERWQATAPTLTRVTYDVVRPDDFQWLTRPHEPGEPARHVAELSDRARFAHVRGNVWRYEPGAKGRRHRHPTQEETFVVLA